VSTRNVPKLNQVLAAAERPSAALFVDVHEAYAAGDLSSGGE
jgi:hypothetical protein